MSTLSKGKNVGSSLQYPWVASILHDSLISTDHRCLGLFYSSQTPRAQVPRKGDIKIPEKQLDSTLHSAPASPHSVTVDGTHSAAWHIALTLVSLHTSKTAFSSYPSHKNLPSVSRTWQRPWLTQLSPCSVCALDYWLYFRMGEQAVTTFFYSSGHSGAENWQSVATVWMSLVLG